MWAYGCSFPSAVEVIAEFEEGESCKRAYGVRLNKFRCHGIAFGFGTFS